MRDTNPLWKRILAGGLAAGVGLTLASLEARAAGDAPEPAREGTADAALQGAKSADPVTITPEWGRLQASFAEAEEVASGRRGDYPFDRAGKDKLLGALRSLASDIDALAGKGFFDAAAADLLKREASTLADEVGAKRPVEMEMATCYEPMPFEPGKRSARRVGERVDALESLAASGKVSPAVLARIRSALERELAGLTEETLGLMKGEERQTASRDAERARRALDRLSGSVPAPREDASADASGDWATLTGAFDQGIRFAGPDGNKQAERDKVKADFAKAEAALVRLRDRGELGTAEADLLLAERKLIETDIFRNPPVDSMVKCYDMQSMPMGAEGLTRVEARLDALERVAAQARIRPETVERVRARLLSDLDLLKRAVADRKTGERGMFRDRGEADRAKDVLERAERSLRAFDGKSGR